MTMSGLSCGSRWLTHRSLVARTTVSTPNSLATRIAVDRVDTGDAAGTRSLCRIGEQQPDRALTDHGDVQTLELRKLLEAYSTQASGCSATACCGVRARVEAAPTRHRRRPRIPSCRRSPRPSRRRGRRFRCSGACWRPPLRRSRGSESRPSPRHSFRCRREAGPSHRGSPGRSLPHTPAARNRSST